MAEPRLSIPRPRIQSLSDLIFGLALSLGAIQFIGNIPQNHDQLVGALTAFAFSFLILINVWNRYTTIMSAVPVETTLMIRLNMLLLFLVAIEPYLFNVLVFGGFGSALGQEVSAYYGLDIGGMNLVIAYFAHLLTVKEKMLIPSELVDRYKVTRNTLLAGGLIFAASAFPPFGGLMVYSVSLRIVIWLLAIPVVWLSRIFGKEA